MSILNHISSPADLKRLSCSELCLLAEEIREILVRVCASSGGHLAPNLGVVELTIALHRVLDAPHDRILWDVSHQCYVHKLLTGRKHRISTIRQKDGLSGFARRYESQYDCWGAGHGGTALSAALGMAQARALTGENYRVVAVVGDGSLTAGMCYEALNHAGEVKIPLVVVLNDNEMSIAKNTGAIARYLAKLRMDSSYQKLKAEVRETLERLPVGEEILSGIRRLKKGLKGVLVPGVLFEELGFTYLGPVDGHNCAELTRFLEDALEINGPVLIHALTVKGKGYPYAERDSRKFHGLGAFDADSGEIRASPGSRPTFTQAFGDIICRIAGKNTDVVAITAAMPDGTGLSKFEKAYPDRFFDVAMAEQHAVCFAAGMATAGKRPVAAIYSTFLQRAYDQVIHDVCIQDLPVLFAVDRAGIVGQDGETHQGAFDIAYLRTVPNIVLAAPKDEWELEQMMLLALDQPHPFAVRYPRAEIPDFPEADNEPLFLGRGQMLRQGNDLCIIALGPHCRPALDAAEGLSRRGIEAAVLNARFAKPLPEEQILQLAARSGRVVTVEDGALMGGFGSAVLELFADRKDLSVKIRRIGIPDRVIEHGTRDEMLRECGMDATAIESAALSLFDDRPSAVSQQAYAMVLGKVVQG